MHLKPKGDIPCNGDFWSNCSLVDQEGVEHSIYDGKVVVKVLLIPTSKDIGALSIGTARSKPEVVEAVNTFIAPKSLKCIGIDEDECSAIFGNATLKLMFDRADKVEYVRLDDWATQ